MRQLLLEALRELVAGSSSQQLLLPLRYAEAALPACSDGSDGGGSSAALPLCELVLVLLEGGGGNRQQRLLGQHSERLAALLTAFIDGTVYAAISSGQVAADAAAQHQKQQALTSLQQLASTILTAGKDSGGGSLAQDWRPATLPAGRGAAAATSAAALSTALRALESMAARPKLFLLPAAAVSGMLSSVAAVWTSSSDAAGGHQFTGRRLDTTVNAGLFSGCCHLLLALLRHRQQVRCGCACVFVFRFEMLTA